MKTTTANYDTENAKSAKKFAGIVDLDGLSRRYYAPTFSSPGANDKKYLKKIRILNNPGDLLTSPILANDRIAFQVLDKDLDVTSILQSNSMVGQTFTPSIGFQNLADSDFVDFPSEIIEKPSLVDEKCLSWQFVSVDGAASLTGVLFENIDEFKTNAAEAIDTTETDIDVDDASVLIDPANITGTWLEDRLGSFMVIDDEIMLISSIAGNTVTVLRNQLGTTNAAHANSARVFQSIRFSDMKWSDMLLCWLLTTTDGSGHAHYDLASFDANMGGFGLGVAEADVDISGIEELGWKILPIQAEQYGKYVDEPEDALKQIERLLKMYGLYLYRDGDGKITVESFNFIHIDETYSAVTTVDNDNIKSGIYEQRDDKLVSRIKFNGLNDTDNEIELDEAITDYGDQLHTVDVDWDFAAAGTTNPAPRQKFIAMHWLYFFANAPAFVKCDMLTKEYIIDKGDQVNITWDKFPDLIAGTRGWTDKKSIVISREANFDFDAGSSSCSLEFITWELYDRVDNFYTLTTRNQAAISPNDTLDFTTNAFFDFAVTQTPGAATATIEVTPPGSGSTHHWFDLTCFAYEDDGGGGFDDRGSVTVRVRYLSSDSTAFNVKIMWHVGDGTSGNLDRIEVDYSARSTSGSEEATMELVEVQSVELDQAMTVN